jgi:hypothetical protein
MITNTQQQRFFRPRYNCGQLELYFSTAGYSTCQAVGRSVWRILCKFCAISVVLEVVQMLGSNRGRVHGGQMQNQCTGPGSWQIRERRRCDFRCRKANLPACFRTHHLTRRRVPQNYAELVPNAYGKERTAGEWVALMAISVIGWGMLLVFNRLLPLVTPHLPQKIWISHSRRSYRYRIETKSLLYGRPPARTSWVKT